ncbi:MULTISPECIES: zinc ABC transporter substrate-binding protein ZnuA [unclassified Thioalkalivibrio]|uniref:zinc ABC transporter substrate-binding protein ZnuA n=1 Tax=unclassified Thioalkalivibrio TaxID=2621013 RepID=UPI00037DD8CC|nr:MULTISPECIES: zinc ABC transporter substrate-binding protein ZnuA [unclassified Thioalkalivibrio]
MRPADRRPNRLALLTALALLLALAAPAQAEGTRIVASILPVHSLVAALAGDTHEVELLVPASASPHGYAMRPSEARRLQQADIVVWVGPELEGFLERSLQGVTNRATVISLLHDLDLPLLEGRSGGVWEGHHDHGDHGDHAHDDQPHDHHGHGERGDHHEALDRHEHDHADHEHGDHAHAHDTHAPDAHGSGDHGHGGHDHDHGHAHGDVDSHLWLSPAVATAVVEQLADRLAEHDPDQAATIRDNRDRLLQRIEDLDAGIAEQLEPVRDQRFMVFHDAYQYFERHYGLNAAGSISVDPSRMPGARRLSELRTRLAEGDVTCLFTEPQFRPALAETVVEGTDTRLGMLDPIGAELEPGPDAWFDLMQGLADGFTDCMAADAR